jgi:hypothetical protein
MARKLSTQMQDLLDRIDAAGGEYVTDVDFRTGMALVRRGLVETTVVDRQAWIRGWRRAR